MSEYVKPKIVIGKPDEPDARPVLNMWLEEYENGIQWIVQGKTSEYTVLRFNVSTGKFKRLTGVSPKLGLPLDEARRVRIENT